MRKSSVPMAEPTMADPANAVEAAALLVEAVDAGTAVEAMRIVFSATAGWRRKQLAKQLQSQKPQQSSGSEEIARLQGEVEKLQEEAAAKDAAMEKTLRDHEWLEEGRALAADASPEVLVDAFFEDLERQFPAKGVHSVRARPIRVSLQDEVVGR